MLAAFEARKAGYKTASKEEREIGRLEVDQFLPPSATHGAKPIKREIKPYPNIKKLEEERIAKLNAIHALPIEKKRQFWNKTADFIAAMETKGGAFQLTDENEYLFELLFKHAIEEKPQKGIVVIGNTGAGKTMLFSIYQKYFNDYWGGELYAMRIRAKKYLEEKGKGSALSLESKNVSRLWIEDLGSEERLKVYGNEITVDSLLDKLYDDFKYRGQVPLICTNLDIDAITERYGERIISRLYQMADFYLLEGRDFRLPEL